MAKYRTVAIEIWEDPYIESLPFDAKLYYVYLITACRSNLGIIDRSIAKMCFETGIPNERMEELLAMFEEDGKVVRDGGDILVVNFIKHQTCNSPKIVKGLVAEFGNVKSAKLRAALISNYPGYFCDDDKERIGYICPFKGYQPQTKPYAEMEMEMEKEMEVGRGTGGNAIEAADTPPLEADASAPQTSLFDSEPSVGLCVTLEEVAKLWNEMMVPEGFASVNMNLLSEDRRAHLRGRQRTFKDARGIKFWKKIFTVVLRSSFLRGDKTDWKANFDFCIESNKKLRKIIEGGYDDNKPVETWIPYDGENAA